MPNNPAARKTALEKIARSGRPMEHFQSLIDEVLGTKLPENDVELDEEFERGRRR